MAHSSPVVWGNKVFVTTAVTSGAKDETRFGLYGDVAPVKDDPKHTWKVYALDKATGKILWERIAYEGMPKVKRHPKSTHADSTPVTDGKYLVVLFGSQGLYAYDLNGKLLWKQDLGVLDAGWFYDADYQWEYGSSPIIYKNLVIVQADVQKDSFIAAYRLKTGKLVWKTPREEISSWGTPTVYEGKTRAELITNGSKAIRGYDPATGKELWRLTPNSEVTTPTPFVAHDLIFVTSGYRSDSTNLRDQARRQRRHLAEGRQGLERVHRLEQTARRSIHADAGRLWRSALHLLEPGRADCLQRKDRRASLSGAAGRQGRRVYCFAGRLRWQDLSVE